ncbi:MAG: GIY-YIG nuclease family protein [Thermoplasmatota archaeon]
MQRDMTRLTARLRDAGGQPVELSLDEIEEIVRGLLPPSARKHTAWWATNGHDHAAAWQAAGYVAVTKRLRERIISFVPQPSSGQPTDFERRRATSTPSSHQVAVDPRIGVATNTPHEADADPPQDRNAIGVSIYADDGVQAEFRFVCLIEPEQDARGRIITFRPHLDYDNSERLDLLPGGEGPFCRFRIPRDMSAAGVYILNNRFRTFYVGECANLSVRFNTGYGQISPRNCFVGGQSTNIRLNALILEAASDSQTIELWFHPTANRFAIERELISTLRPDWNRRGNRPS